MTQTLTSSINKHFMKPHYIAATNFLMLFKRFSTPAYIVWGTGVLSALIVGLVTTEVSEFRHTFIQVTKYPLGALTAVILLGALFHIIQGFGIRAVEREMKKDEYYPTRQQVLDEIDAIFRARRLSAFRYHHYLGNHPGLIVAAAVVTSSLTISILEKVWVMTIFSVWVLASIFVGSWIDYQTKLNTNHD